jgi:hypothetical protein
MSNPVMKTIHHTILKSLLLLMVILTVCSCALADSFPTQGSWKGKFMQQFDLEIMIIGSQEEGLSGEIKMFDGSNMIQDDPITDIKINGNEFTFFIPDKNTSFKGLVSSGCKEIIGHFIFPDGSTHPLKVYYFPKAEKEQKNNYNTTSNFLNKSYSTDQLKEDIFFLNENLSHTHPQYHLYTSHEDFEKLYQSVIENLDHELTTMEFYTLIAPIVARVGCSHTGIMLPKDGLNELYQTGYYFPLKLFFSENRAWIVSASHDTSLVIPGSEIKSINHVPVENIITRLLSIIPSEGYNYSSKYHELNHRFAEYYIYLNNADSFPIGFIKPGESRETTAVISAAPYDMILQLINTEEYSLPISYSVDKTNDLANLKIQSFGIRDFERYVHFMDSVFLILKEEKIGNLIIDLRDNNGGHPIFAAILYSYLTQNEFTYFKENPDVPDFEPLYKPMQANANSFDGKCYVLINGGCLSTTGHLVSLLKYHKRAVFIGEEPGSWFYCNDFSKQITLPNTQIEVNIPRATFETKVSGYKMGDSFQVDYSVKLSLRDVLFDTDAYMEFTRNLIQ